MSHSDSAAVALVTLAYLIFFLALVALNAAAGTGY